MTWNGERLRQLLREERTLLRELALMLVATLVVGVYFLEHVHSTLADSRREAAEALAQQVASSATEYVVTGNRLSLNVIASHAASLDTVARIEFRSIADVVLASAGTEHPADKPVSRGMRLDDDTMVGTVLLWSANTSAQQEEGLESGFVLVVIILLMLRVAVELIWRRLRQERQGADDIEADMVPVLSMTPPGEIPKAFLRISIVNFDRMQQRFTQSLMDEVVQAYDALLRGIAEVYGAHTLAPLGRECALEFRAESRAQAGFQALCAGMLFRRVARSLSETRKAQGRTPLEFKLLVTTEADLRTSWSVCIAGQPGRVHVPEAELLKLELDVRALYQPERCIAISDGELTMRLQPVEQLAQRYQKLIADQADRLLASGDDGGVLANR
jgi:hypothetical protein